ncbi:MAG TPA: PTS sugar transporter subunit IIA [Gemmatimonadales bacterium]|nr:PTS sugar transporter subunit IIA [Gemmatimonadales bacterium]
MQLSLREAASYLGVDEATLRRWIRTRGVPVHRADERLHLNAIELWEWATENGVPVSRRLLEQARSQPEQVAPLSSLLVTGGIHYNVAGETKAAVLRQIVTHLPLPPEVDRDFLVTVLEAREAMGSTGIGDGIAIPHVRNPILLHVPAPFVTLCLLRHPVEFDAVDGKPVHALFSVISPTVPAHLRILAQLAVVLRDGELRQLLASRAAADHVLNRIRGLEARTSGARANPSAPA